MLLGNALTNAKDAKYRRLRKDNERFRQRIGLFGGALDVLLAAGFVDDGDFYVLPADADAEELRRAYLTCRLAASTFCATESLFLGLFLKSDEESGERSAVSCISGFS